MSQWPLTFDHLISWVQEDVYAKFEEIPSRYFWDIVFMRMDQWNVCMMDGRPENQTTGAEAYNPPFNRPAHQIRQIWNLQHTHCPPTGHSLRLLPPSLYTRPQSSWSPCGAVAWTSSHPSSRKGTPCRTRPARPRSSAGRGFPAASWFCWWSSWGWGVRRRYGNPRGSWSAPGCARFSPPRTGWACWARRDAGSPHRTAGPCPPWWGSPPTPCRPAQLQSHCWSVWTCPVWGRKTKMNTRRAQWWIMAASKHHR